MADLAKLVDELSALTVMEAADLSKMLEEKWGVSAAAAVAVAAAVPFVAVPIIPVPGIILIVSISVSAVSLPVVIRMQIVV